MRRAPKGLLRRFAIVLTLAAACAGFGAANAAGAIYTVNQNADGGDGVCDVTCTLRDAILNANTTPGTDGIAFAVGDGGMETLSVTSQLPVISGPVIIDGLTQPGSITAPVVEVNGAGTVGTTGLWITADDSTVRGLVVRGFAERQLWLDGSDGSTIEGNYFGTDVPGLNADAGGSSLAVVEIGGGLVSQASSGNTIRNNVFSDGLYLRGSGTQDNVIVGNRVGLNSIGNTSLWPAESLVGIGILLDSAASNTIGGTTAADRNYVSVHFDAVGIEIVNPGATGNTVLGNYIGTDVTGTVSVPNRYGVRIIAGPSGNIIGGTAPGSRNVISGQVGGMTPEDGDGVHINDADGNTVLGNYIGLAADGTTRLQNSGDGIQVLSSDGTTIGGTSAAARNVVSGNNGHGVFLLEANNTTVRGNRIGTNAAGTDDVSNNIDGIAVEGSSNNVIGGPAAGAGNLVSGNGSQGISLFTGFGSELTPTGNTIQGNLVGTDASGTALVSNGGTGIVVALSSATQVGGTAAGAGNVVSGNFVYGVRIAGSSSTVVEGNRIGVRADGSPLGNLNAGVRIDTAATGSRIGGIDAGAGNVIANNSNGIGTGVNIAADGGSGHSVLGNSIYDNGGLGIDLSADSVTANDEGDNDAGPNGLQNFPELETASSGSGTVSVTGSLAAGGGTAYRVEVFLSPACDGTHGEGRTYLGSVAVTTSGSVGGPGSGSFSGSFLGTAVEGDVVTATATAPDGSTSEFSACLAVAAGAGASGLTLTSDEDSVPVGVQSFPLGSLPGDQLPAYSGAPGSAPVGSIPVGSIPVGSIPVGSIPVGSIPVGSIPVGSIPVGSIPVGSIPVGSIGLGSIPVGSIGLRQILLSQLPVNWDVILANTPLAAGPRQSQTLADVYANATARQNFEALPFAQSGLAQSLLRGAPLAAFLLGGAPLNQLPAPGGGSWCGAITDAGGSCTGVSTASNTVLGLTIAGLPVGSIPVGSIPVGSIPASTPVGSIPVGSIPVGSIDLDAARLAGVLLSTIPAAQLNAVVDCGRVNCGGASTLGTAKAAGAIRPDATLAQLLGTDTDGTLGQIGQPPVQLILNDIILGTIPRSALDWERFPLDGLQLFGGTGKLVHYRLDLNLPCAQASGLALNVKLPAGFIVKPGTSYVTYGASVPLAGGNPVTSSESGATWSGAALPAPGPCAAGAGAAQLVKLEFDAYSGFSINTKTASASATFANGAAALSDTDQILVTQNWESNDDPASAPVIGTDALHVVHLATNRDREVFRLPVPTLRGTRTTVYLSHIPQGSDYDLVIGQPSAPPLISSPVGSIPVGSIPVPDEGSSVDNSGKTLAPETLQDIPVGSIPVGSISATRGNATEAATVVSQGEAGFYTIQVSGYNGSRSTEAAVLRVVQTPPPALPACPARTFPNAAGPNGTLPGSLPPATRALFLYNRSQLVALHGTAATDAMLGALDALIANLAARQSDPIGAAKLDVSGSAAVRSAYAAWNASPCSIGAANDVTKAVNDVVAGYRSGGGLAGLEYVTLLGSDEALPMARLQDPVTISNELDEASDLAFLTAGGTRANALYAAAALGHFLSDAPYGTFVTTPWLNRQLYLPTVPVSRLVETPLEIQRQLELFVTAEGVLNPDSALTTAYDFLTDGGEAVKAALDRFGPNGVSQGLISNTWDANALGGVLTPSASAPADIASVNAHYNHYLLQPAAGQALFSSGNLPALPANPTDEPAFARRILFTMGCHAGLNVADTLLGASDPKLTDWAQAYAAQRAAIYVANTGFGYGDTVANALSERLMSIFGRQIGRNGSIGADWLRSMHDYYNTMGFYGVYDEKALSEATMYGLPFWRVGSAPASPPVPVVTPGGDGTATTTVVPSSVAATAPGRGTFWSENGETDRTQHTHYRPIQPVVSLDATLPVSDGRTLRGAFITALTTTEVPNVDPFNALPMIDLAANEPERDFEQTFFPANVVHITRSRQGSLMRQSVEVVTGQSRPEGDGEVTERLLQSIGLQVGYSAGADTTKPLFRQVGGTLVGGTLTVFAEVVDTTGTVAQVQALVNDGSSWRLVTLSGPNSAGLWTGTLQNVAVDPEILYQARDGDWNVAFTTNKGFNFRAVPNDATGPEVHIERPLPVHTLGESVKAEFSCYDPGGVNACTATVDGADVPNGATLPPAALTLGAHAFTVTAVDVTGNQTTVTRPYIVIYPFAGFFEPVDNLPVLNVAKAGSTIPLKFSLGGNRGTAIFANGYPQVRLVSCGTTAVNGDVIEETTTKSGLTFDSASGRYHYNWRTEKSWAGTCRELILRLVDGTEHRAIFRME